MEKILRGNSATPLMIAATPQSPEVVGMLGHVEYTLMDDAGIVKAYMQTDNVVTQDGANCSAEAIFGGSSGTCIAEADFNFIGIGNQTLTGGTTHLGIANQTLGDATDDGTGTCAAAAVGGDMARRSVTSGITPATGGLSGAVVILNTDTPFSFDESNKTTVIDSGVFNANYGTPNDQGTCGGSNVAGTNWNMFSRQLLDGETGIAVSAGDSLTVKWTITVG